MSYFGVYIPPSKAGFEGSTSQCAGSIAAVNIKPVPEAAPGAATDETASKYEDPDYPPDSPLWLIFTEKSKALEVLRHFKEARLREFPNREQAESYVQFGFESIKSLKLFGKAKTPNKQVGTSLANSLKNASDSICSLSPLNASINSMLSSPFNSGGIAAAVNANNNGITRDSAPVSLNCERPPFRSPTKPELVEFRKQIEAGNYERVKRIIWDNPRFLISSGDTPTSLKEGYRYNAMHICAQSNQARIAELILKVIANHEFTMLYVGKKGSDEMCATLNENLLDYYLNIPDKGRGETPLHFAVKLGHVPVVEVLTSYPQCKSLYNKDGELPKDIICQRAPNATPDIIVKINLLLKGPFYVPVLRAPCNELPPQIGQPFTPTDPPNLLYKSGDSEHLTVKLSISALAGPMPREQAVSFCRRWKTPPRVGSSSQSPITSSPYISPKKMAATAALSADGNSHDTAAGRRLVFSPSPATYFKGMDQENGNHKAGELCNGDSANGDESQQATSASLCLEIENNNNYSMSENQQNTTIVKATSTSSISLSTKTMLELPATPVRQLKPELFNVYRINNPSPFVEEMSFGTQASISMEMSLNMSVSTLNDSFRERHIKNSDIEKGLEIIGRQLARQEQLEWREHWDFLSAFIDISSPEGLRSLENYLLEKSEQAWNFSQMHHYLDLVSDRTKTSTPTSGVNEFMPAAAVTQVMTPYTCVEKSLQVFAKRITKTLLNNIGNHVSINDTLLSELKRLKSLIVSFREDARFMSVNFGKVHSRITNLVPSYIAQSQEIDENINNQIRSMLRDMLNTRGGRRDHLGCVCAIMLKNLQNTTALDMPETLKTEDACLMAWENESLCECQWDANLTRTGSMQSRKAGRRMREEQRAAAASSGLSESSTSSQDLWRSKQLSDDDDTSGDEETFFECSNDLNSDNEVYMTPPENVTPATSSLALDNDPPYELFIFGKKPTKRDLDVLNAIFHVDVQKETHPHVYAWKAAMENFSASEMDLFPSPMNVAKTHKPTLLQSTPKSPICGINANSCMKNTSVMPKRLFATPKMLNAGPPRRAQNALTPFRLPRAPSEIVQSSASSPMPQSQPQSQLQSQPMVAQSSTASEESAVLPGLLEAPVLPQPLSFQTPLNKMRGLFSKYRDNRTITPMGPLECHVNGVRTLNDSE